MRQPSFRPLPRKFYDRDTLAVARDLIGKTLVRRRNGALLAGRIVEAEAYVGENDPACHAARGLTARTRIMYGPPGFSYVYFTYGMYFMLNAVCEREGFPAAVLIRAVEPICRLEVMTALRGTAKAGRLTDGPGKLCIAFDITTALNGVDLTRPTSPLQICHGRKETDIAWSGRVGIQKGTEKMWRCFLRGSPFVSTGRPSRLASAAQRREKGPSRKKPR